MKLSIIIVSYNTRDMTLRCIQEAAAEAGCAVSRLDGESVCQSEESRVESREASAEHESRDERRATSEDSQKALDPRPSTLDPKKNLDPKKALDPRPPTHPCEIIVVDNASTDGSAEAIAEIADEVIDLGLDGESGRESRGERRESRDERRARTPKKPSTLDTRHQLTTHQLTTHHSPPTTHNSPPITLLRSKKNLGFGAANNRAMEIARGDYLLLLNSDAFPKPGAFTHLIRFLESNPKVGCVGPKLLNEDGSLQASCFKFPSPWRITCESLLLSAAFPNHKLLGDFRAWPYDVVREVDFAIGACLLVRREVVDSVGMFDEKFFLYAEETDWLKRMWDGGWKVVFTPETEVFHLCGVSGKRQADRVFTEFRRGQEYFIRKHYGWVALQWYRAMVVVGALIRLICFSFKPLLGKSLPRAELDLWCRILVWTLGFRGPGLSEMNHPSPTP